MAEPSVSYRVHVAAGAEQRASIEVFARDGMIAVRSIGLTTPWFDRAGTERLIDALRAALDDLSPDAT